MFETEIILFLKFVSRKTWWDIGAQPGADIKLSQECLSWVSWLSYFYDIIFLIMYIEFNFFYTVQVFV